MNIIVDIFNAIKINPTKYEQQFAESVINGGKTDQMEKANTLCAYFEREGYEITVYAILTKHWRT